MNRIPKKRSNAFVAQGGLCYYCNQPMWLDDPGAFAKRHGLTSKQSRQFMCTLEHLLPRCRGGTICQANVAAACLCCNKKRGRLLVVASPEAFRRRVQSRCMKGKWHAAFPVKNDERRY